MAFYISDITGAQSPYVEELYQLQREQAHLEQARALESAYIAAEGSNVPRVDQAGTASSAKGPQALQAPSANIGTAAAGAGAARGSGSEMTADSTGVAVARLRPYRDPAGRVRPAEHLRGEDAGKLKMQKEQEEAAQARVNPYAKADLPIPKRERAIVASQIMSQPVYTFHADSLVRDAGELFREHRFRHVPVVSDSGRLVGIFSDRDYLTIANQEIPVGEVMTTHVLTARPQTEIRMIADMLFKERIGAMPIVDDGGMLVGIVTRSDILCAVVHKAPLELWV